MSNQSNLSNDDQLKVQDIIREIEQKSKGSGYIYRGEPKCHEKVTSSLYRKFETINVLNVSIEEIQKAEVEEAKRYIKKEDDFEILTEIQHFGGKTNLIDFTTCYCVALFFACDHLPFEDGRVILQNKTGTIKNWIRVPRNSDLTSRIRTQKSIFVQSPRGFIEPEKEEIVVVPKYVKQPMLNYLKEEFSISIESIYPDLHGFVSSQDTRWNAYTEFDKGIACNRNGDNAKNFNKKDENYQKAVGHFTEAINLIPEFAVAYNERGNAYAGKGEVDNAIEDYNSATARKPDYAGAYYNCGIISMSMGDFDEAISKYTEAIAHKPDYADAYVNRGNAYAGKGEVDNAIEDYTKAINLNSKLAVAYAQRGSTYAERGDFDKALEDHKAAVGYAPNFPFFYYNRGRTYYEIGNFRQAISDYTKAINLRPDYADAYLNRGRTYQERGNFDEAITDYTKAINFNPKSVDAYVNRGVVYLERKGEVDKAIIDFTQAINLRPDYALVYFNRGNAYKTRDGLDEAIADYTKAIELRSDYADAYLNRGSIFQSKQELALAIQDYSEAINLEPDSGDAYYNRGLAYALGGKWTKAKSDLTSARDRGIDIPAELWRRCQRFDES